MAKEKSTAYIKVSLPPSIKEKLIELANEKYTTISALVKKLIIRLIEEESNGGSK